ncbi:MAG: anti-sigma factor [Stellaceae bacterium]
MRYDNPELRERLAAEYVLGTMPVRARRRFERLIADDAGLARMVGDWADRWSPLDDAAPAVEPPARVWRAIEAHIGGGDVATVSPSAPSPWFHALAFWRGLAIAASAAAAGLAIYVGLLAGRAPALVVVAVLAGHGAEPGWVAVTGPKPGEVDVSAVAPPAEAKPHAFELWGIAGGPPRSLGLLPQNFGAAAILRTAQLPPPGGVLAVSLEPPGGSPTGVPTGPVLYQGKVLIRPP